MSTHRIPVSFFLVSPIGQHVSEYLRLQKSFEALDVSALRNRDRNSFFTLSGHNIISRDGFVQGAINCGQKGGLLPFIQEQDGKLRNAIDSNQGQSLTYPTCFLYNINSSILLMEHMTKGATVADWCLYAHHQLDKAPGMFASIIEKEASAELIDGLKYITKFEISVAGWRRTDLFKSQTKEMSLGEIGDLAKKGRAGKVSCILTTEVKRRNKALQRPEQDSLDRDYVRQMLAEANGVEDIDQLVVYGLYDQADRVASKINLLDFRLQDSVQVPLEELTVSGMNTARRVARLRELHDKHQNILTRYQRDEH